MRTNLSPGSITPVYVAWRSGTSNRAVVPARWAENRLLDSLKGLQIRAQVAISRYSCCGEGGGTEEANARSCGGLDREKRDGQPPFRKLGRIYHHDHKCTQESEHLQSMYSLVCGMVWNPRMLEVV